MVEKKKKDEIVSILENYDFIISKLTRDFAILTKHLQVLTDVIETIEQKIKEAEKINRKISEKNNNQVLALKNERFDLLKEIEKLIDKKQKDILDQIKKELEKFNLKKSL